MATTNNWFAHALLNGLKGEYDLSTNTIKVMLCTSDFTPSKSGMEHRDEVTNEVVATGYTSGGQALTNVTLTLTNNTITFDADDPEWTIAGALTCRYMVYYIDFGDAALDILIGCVDLGENVTTTDNIFRPVWNEAGILQVVC